MGRVGWMAELAGAALLAWAASWGAEDVVLGTVVDGVDVKLFIPDGIEVLRGIGVHAAHYEMNPQDRWAETFRKMGFAHAALNMDLKRTNRPTILRRTLDAGLKEFAEKSGHPELVHLPFLGVGHSAGGLVTSTLLRTPERTITCCVSCGWITNPAKLEPSQLGVPQLFTLGAIPDAFKMLPGIEECFVRARKKGLPWGLGLQWGCAHDFANSATLFIPWVEAVAEARLPKDASALGGPVKLRELKEKDGWLGDRGTWETHFATVASWADYRGDRSAAVWLPNRYVACVWRAFQSKNPPVVLEAATADGRAKLPPANPKAERGLMVDPDAELRLEATVAGGAAVKKVQFHDGDVLLGEATQAPWQFTWKSIPRGPHALFVQWETADGTRGVSNPALLIVRKTALKGAAK